LYALAFVDFIAQVQISLNAQIRNILTYYKFTASKKHYYVNYMNSLPYKKN